jgi:DnaJ homolog subfamily C member 8
MKSDSISKALRDAEKCVELAPEWSKGYSRLGAAQQALKRFQPAMDTFRKGSIKNILGNFKLTYI